MSPKYDESFSFAEKLWWSEVLEIETRIRLINGNSSSFVFEGPDSDP